MAGALCPNCQAMVTVVGPEIWTMTKCADCGIELEIISVDPFEVDFPAPPQLSTDRGAHHRRRIAGWP